LMLGVLRLRWNNDVDTTQPRNLSCWPNCLGSA
jgi:hypothetical protein